MMPPRDFMCPPRDADEWGIPEGAEDEAAE